MEKEEIFWKLFGLKLISFKKFKDGEIIGTGLLNPIVEKLRLFTMIYLQAKFYKNYENLGRWNGKKVANPFAPPVGSRPQFRALWGLIKSHLFGHSFPTAMTLAVTYRCQCRCVHCSAGSHLRKDSQELTTQEAQKLIDESQRLGVTIIAFTGGEPFLRKDLFDLFEKHGDVTFQIYTNARQIDERMVERLAALGNAIPAISLEGLEEQTDKRRGKGHFQHCVKVMDMLREAGLFFAVSTTQTRENTEVLGSDEFIDLLVDKGCILMWNFHYVPIGRVPDLHLMATPEQRNYMRERFKHFRATEPMLFVDFWNDGHLTNGCIAGGKKYLHITASGDVEPCVFCHFAADNIKDKSLLEALNSPLMREIRSRQPFSDNPFRPCMLIDEPAQGREMALKYARRFTHPGAETLFTELAEQMDDYSSQFKPLADAAWEEHQLNKNNKCKAAAG